VIFPVKKLILIALSPISAFAASITTTFSSNNEFHGNMFEIRVIPEKGIRISDLQLNLETGIHDIEVYGKSGGWFDSVTTPSDWEWLGTATSVNGLGEGIPTEVDISDFFIPMSSQYSLYVTTTGTRMFYTTGSGSFDLYSENADIQIFEGRGNAYSFIGSNVSGTSRIWNGTLNYTVVPETNSILFGILGMTIFVSRRERMKNLP